MSPFGPGARSQRRPALRSIRGGRLESPDEGVEAALREIEVGRMLVLLDDARDRGYLIAAATQTSTETIVHLSIYGRGVLSVTMPVERLAELELASIRTGSGESAYHVPVDFEGHDRPPSHSGRAATVRALGDRATRPGDLVSPGHVFCLEVGLGGVLEHPCGPEAAADLAQLAGAGRIAVLCEAGDEQGGPADVCAARRLARRLAIQIVSVADVTSYRERVEPSVARVVSVALPTLAGALEIAAFVGDRSEAEYLAFCHGDLTRRGLEVCVHAQCQVGDVFGSLACGCSESLHAAIETIHREGAGMIVYATRSDRSALRHLLGCEDPPRPSYEVDVAHVLRDAGVTSARISSNETIDIAHLTELGVEVLSHRLPGAAPTRARAL